MQDNDNLAASLASTLHTDLPNAKRLAKQLTTLADKFCKNSIRLDAGAPVGKQVKEAEEKIQGICSRLALRCDLTGGKTPSVVLHLGKRDVYL